MEPCSGPKIAQKGSKTGFSTLYPAATRSKSTVCALSVKTAVKRNSGAYGFWLSHKEVIAACAPSKIPQLHASRQDVVMTVGMQEPPRRGKDQLEQNVM
jgi:hypothetical protein